MSLGRLLGRIAPVVAGQFLGPGGAALTGAAVRASQKRPTLEGTNNMIIDPNSLDPGLRTAGTQQNYTVAQPSLLNRFGTFTRGLAEDIGTVAQNVLPLARIFGTPDARLQRAAGQQAVSIDLGSPQETAQSGTIAGANLGLVPGLLQGAGRFLARPGVQGGLGALGLGAGALMSVDGSGSPRITRKMKADVRRIFMMTGMNPAATAEILNQMGTYPRINFDATVVFLILLKRFRNDGPVVTKAALRKTRQTMRRMKSMCDMYDSFKKAPARRRTTRATAAKGVQLIKN